MGSYSRQSPPTNSRQNTEVLPPLTRARSDVSGSVHNLLLSTKLLQERLKKWSIGQATETQISDAYVKIGQQFNMTINAFACYHIDLSDIYSVPDELRVPLEHCLVNEPSPEALAMHMPEIRRALYKLYEGIKARQDVWRAAVIQMSRYP